ncbi:MAG: 1-acyl-sn-glycerol-3-phosphate acyltransferase [Spirochaetales bacterium]|nr:1-acyl-sn-glycerol-3-phosphate acyltransferase [Spirochaetales bacterium]
MNYQSLKEKKKPPVKIHGWLTGLLGWTLGIFLRIAYNLKVENRNILSELSPPFLLLPNHMNTFDPFIIGTILPWRISYIASDSLFRNKQQRFLLKLLGTIPTTKAMSDSRTIRMVVDVIRHKGVVGLFSEGQRTWDGVTLPLYYSAAKLIKFLKVPVLPCLLKGGYLSLPRWSPHRRRGRLKISFQKVLTTEEIRKLSVDHIYQWLTEALSFDEFEYQRNHHIIFRSFHRAEFLECMLFYCPSCGGSVTLRSKRNRLCCTACGAHTRVNMEGFFTNQSSGFPFETMNEWNQWQLKKLREKIASGSFKDQTVYIDKEVSVFHGYRSDPLELQGKGTIKLHYASLEIETCGPDGNCRIPIAEMSGIHVVMHNTFEFYYEGILFSLKFKDRRDSGYKYLSYIEAFREIILKLEDTEKVPPKAI